MILAPTDAALGQAVVTLRLPSRVRQGLNVESGLNDGICVPVFWIVLAIAQAESGAIGDGAAVRLMLEQIGYGILAGVAAGVAAAGVVVVASRHAHIGGSWLQIVPLAGAGLAFGIADPIGGSGFIAAFVGGLSSALCDSGPAVSRPAHRRARRGALSGHVHRLRRGAARAGSRRRDLVDRPVRDSQSDGRSHAFPVAIAMTGTGARGPTLAFLGWFGPRGLASIVFAVLVLEEGGLPHDDLLLVATYVTIGVSILAHGLTAAPLAERYAAWFESHPRNALPSLEGSEVRHARWRFPVGHPVRGAERTPCDACSRSALLGLAGAVLIVATFAYFLPTIADYRDVWQVVKAMSWKWVAALLAASAVNVLTSLRRGSCSSPACASGPR